VGTVWPSVGAERRFRARSDVANAKRGGMQIVRFGAARRSDTTGARALCNAGRQLRCDAAARGSPTRPTSPKRGY